MLMNKRSTLFACLGVLVGLAAVPVYGQAWGVRVKIPFKFAVANKTLPEGEYVLSAVRDEVFVQDSDGKRLAMVLTNAIAGRAVGKTGEVVFECYTNLCFLSQVWTPDQDTGHRLLRSQLESAIAKRETGKYVASPGTEKMREAIAAPRKIPVSASAAEAASLCITRLLANALTVHGCWFSSCRLRDT